jgi:hypothetical protein
MRGSGMASTITTSRPRTAQLSLIIEGNARRILLLNGVYVTFV